MSLSDIQLRIIMSVLGSENMAKLNASMAQAQQSAQNLQSTSRAGTTTAQQSAQATSEQAKQVSNLSESYTQAYLAGYTLIRVGTQLTQIGKAGLGMLDDALSAWGDYEFALNRAAGALSIWNKDSTSTQVGQDQLSKAVHDAAKEARLFPAEDVARATYYWGAATGQTVETQQDLKTAMSAVIPIMKAAAITETGYEAAIKGVYSILVQYHKGLDQATDVTEKMMLASQKTALEFNDLVQAFKFVGPMADGLGISFDDVVMIMGRLGDAGIRSTMVGRALSMTFTRLVKPTLDGKNALDDAFKATVGLGQSFDDLVFPNGEFVGMTKLLDYLSMATENLTQKEKFNLLGRAATQNELRILIPLIDQQTRLRHKSADAIDEEKYSLEGAHAAFEKTFDLLKNSWQGVQAAAQRAIEPIIHLVGSQLADSLKPVVEKVTELIDGFGDFLQQNPQVVKALIAFISTLSAALAVAGSILAVIGTVKLLDASFSRLGRTVLGVTVPFVGIGLALAALSAAAASNFGGIGDALSHLMDALGRLASAFLHIISGGKDAANALGGLHDPLEVVARVVAILIDNVANLVDTLAESKAAVAIIGGILTGFLAWKVISGIISGISVALGIMSTALEVASGAVGVLRAAFVLLSTVPIIAVISAIIIVIAALYGAWQTNFMGMRDTIQNVFATIVDIIGNVVGTIVGVVKELIKFIGSFPNPLQGWAKDTSKTLDDIENSVKTWGHQFHADTKDATEAVEKEYLDHGERTNRIVERMNADRNKVNGEGLNTMVDQTMGALLGIEDVMETGGKAQAETVVPFLKQIKQYYRDTWDEVNLNAQGGMARTHIVFAAGGEQVAQDVGQMSDDVIGQMQTMKNRAIFMADSTVTSLAQAIKDGRDEAKNAWKNLVDAMKHPMSRMKEIAWLEGKLSSKKLHEATSSKDPYIRALGEEAKITWTQRLNELQTWTDGAGKKTSENLGKGLKKGKKKVQESVDEVGNVVKDWRDIRNNAETWGGNITSSFAKGLAAAKRIREVRGAVAQIGQAVMDALEGHSPPKVGPMKTIDIGAKNIAIAWADGFLLARSHVQNRANELASTMNAGLMAATSGTDFGLDNNFNLRSTSQKVMTVRVEVVSPDGSVDKVKADQLADALAGTGLVRAIEHAASLDMA